MAPCYFASIVTRLRLILVYFRCPKYFLTPPPPFYYQDSLKEAIQDIIKGYEPKFFQVYQVRQDANTSLIGSDKQRKNITTF